MLLDPYPKQAWTINESTARINIWDGSISAGKTIACDWRWIQYIFNDEVPGNLAMIGKTERALKRNVIDPLIETFGEDNIRHSIGTGEAFIFGRRVYIVGANDARAEGKIRGITLAGALGDEITLWPEDFFTMLLGRLRVPGAKLFATTNPDTPVHYIKKKYLDRVGELDLRHFHFKIDDNPMLDASYVRSVKAEYSGLWYKRYIEGVWCVAEGSVYSMFDTDSMVIDTESDLQIWWIAIDQGARNATVFQRCGIDKDGRFVVTHEYYHSGRLSAPKSPAIYSRDFRAWLDQFRGYPAFIFIDPAAKGFSDQLFDDGVTAWPAENAVRAGIEFVSSLMTNDLFRVHRRCTNLIEQIQAYVWNERSSMQGEDRPVKENDDCVDTMRYGAFSMRHMWARFNRFDDPKHMQQEAA